MQSLRVRSIPTQSDNKPVNRIRIRVLNDEFETDDKPVNQINTLFKEYRIRLTTTLDVDWAFNPF